MEDILVPMRESIQGALENLSSPRASLQSKTKALETLEQHFAMACASTDQLDCFLALQYTFECNIPSRLLSWIEISTSKLELLANKGVVSSDFQRESETYNLAAQLSLSLSLIQGAALVHDSSKVYLGSKYALEILLNLLLASRHISTPAVVSTSGSKTKQTAAPALPLTSVVLDTLLCVLVDSTPALRRFEEANGIQAVVKILKRAGTPREVRMKCLEFLYFYLLDETPSSSTRLPAAEIPLQPTPPSSIPPTPRRPSKPSLNAKLALPSSRSGSSPFLSTSTSSHTPSSSRSASGSSTHSFSSTSSNASSSTAASSISSSPEKPSVFQTPSHSPLPHRKLPSQLQPRSLLMLKKEVDYEPQSPKKAQLGINGLSRSKSLSSSRLASETKTDDHGHTVTEKAGGNWKTTEEKKELLGTMLGNVDALVEGVRKAGIWGLG